MSADSQALASRLARHLGNHGIAKDLGEAYTEMLFKLPLAEVISLNDMADEIETKLNEYFEAGVRLVWVVYPRQERFYVYDSFSQIRRLTRSDTLDGGSVLPLSELFPQSPPAANPPATP